ncbi:MAG: mechanosensitive ion channel domain-containing protein [archaeon]
MDTVSTVYSGFEQMINGLIAFLPTLIFVGVVLVIAFIVIKIIQSLIRKALKKTKMNTDIQHITYRVSGWGMWFLVLSWLIGSMGLDAIFASLLGLGALAGLAVAMAVKDSLSDVVSGMLLLSDRHFDLGDIIETQGHKGELIDVSLRKTRLKAEDGTIIVLANAKIDSSGWKLLKRKKSTQKK